MRARKGSEHAYDEKLGQLTLSELSVHLSTENVEEVGRGCAVCDLHVAVLVLAVELVGCREDAGILFMPSTNSSDIQRPRVLTSLQSCKNLSILPELCSGP